MASLLSACNLTKLYGVVIGVNDLSLELEPGVHGLLGPNGAGKSTLLKLITGQLRPTEGSIRVLGEDPWNNPSLFRHVGYCPEHDSFWPFLSAREFVESLARMSGLSRDEAQGATLRALEKVGATGFMDRKISEFSKGMRQRTKVAQAIVHEPKLLILDEPLTGTDPVGRREMMDLVRGLGRENRSVIVSSHVMHEVQAMTHTFMLIYGGRVLAAGDMHEIRGLLDQIPHRVRVACDSPRALASSLTAEPDVLGVEVDEGHGLLWVSTTSPRDLFRAIARRSKDLRVALHEMGSEDESLDAVFGYLVRGGL